MQSRGSAVGFMRHVNACCRQASSITVTRYVIHRGETKSRRYTKKLGSRSSCLGRCLVSPRGTMCMSGDWMRIRKSCVFRKIPPAFQYTTHKSDDARRGRGVSCTARTGSWPAMIARMTPSVALTAICAAPAAGRPVSMKSGLRLDLWNCRRYPA
ncbi:hypothetical protein EVAR_76116_1 [Eumeta japonica]|uniref:Uncharacterized protein n=1 Tax=Eumeta variegata TaxID=151549 RepID=A0A4C2A4V2_EUMVA|nr:hypothetical protein EVAR_76116_1 [Eumeta japonica]